MRRAASKNKYPVKSLVKALQILDALAKQPSGCGITELSEMLRIGKSTVHRLLATLKEEGYVVFHPVNSRYILGGRIAKLAQQLSEQSPLLTFGVPIIQRLAREYNETVNLAILEGTEVVYIAGEEGRELLRSHCVLGYRAAAHATALGKVCLSDLSDEEIHQCYGRVKRLAKTGPKTITSINKLLEEVSSVRKSGFAYDNEESGSGVYCIAAPIWDYSGRLVAALSFSLPKSRMTATRRPALREGLLRASGRLSEALGYFARSGRDRATNGRNSEEKPHVMS